MLKTLYKRHPYFFNMLAVLVLLTIVRMLDNFAWVTPRPERTKIILLDSLFEFITFFSILLLLLFTFRQTLKRKQIIVLYSLIIVYSVLGPILYVFLDVELEFLFWPEHINPPLTINTISKYAPGGSLVILFLAATYYLTSLKLQSEKQLEETHKAETLAKDIQLKMLRYQINPHFLFNVLNSIYTLIDENTEKAKKLVIDMSEYYRYTLNKQEHTISIEKEVESIKKYFEIQKTRFEEEFHYEISVDEAVKSVLIPSFLIHLLVENAIKYGTKTEKQKLIVNLSIIMVNKKLSIKVSNTGKLLIAKPDGEKNIDGTGNGIENLNQRLSLYYDDNYSFSLKEEDGWVIAAIEINNINT